MKNNFSIYLLYMLIVSVFLIILFAVTRTLKKMNRRKTNKPLIHCGSVSVFFDKYTNATIIPYVKDKYGAGRATSGIQILKWPFSVERLGNTVRGCMLSCNHGKPCTNEHLMSMLESKGWKEFSQGKRNVSVHNKDNSGIVFNATIRTADGAYHFHQAGNKVMLPGDIDDETIGKTVLSLLQNCR